MLSSISGLFGQQCLQHAVAGSGSAKALWMLQAPAQAAVLSHTCLAGFSPARFNSIFNPLKGVKFCWLHQHLLALSWGVSSLPLSVLRDLSPDLGGEKQHSGNPLRVLTLSEMQEIPRSAVTLVSPFAFIFFFVF